ncbi:hypothetical protein [Streptomyces sp. NPDC007074]|uniref:hypothetical protein n=1 Tax=unclassified Streptomyces TaxID=2593676 RepID=UPI0033D064B0
MFRSVSGLTPRSAATCLIATEERALLIDDGSDLTAEAIAETVPVAPVFAVLDTDDPAIVNLLDAVVQALATACFVLVASRAAGPGPTSSSPPPRHCCMDAPFVGPADGVDEVRGGEDALWS